jgi:hypothetical protein
VLQTTGMRGVTHRRLPLMVFGFGLFVFGAALFGVSGVDVGFHVRTGMHILETGAIPSTNTFSFTQPDEPWLCQQWWPGVLFAVVYAAAGVGGLIVLKALLAAAMFLVALTHAAECGKKEVAGNQGAAWLAALLTGTLCAWLSRVRFFIRPFMLSGLFFALLGLLDARHDRRWRWHALGVPLLMAVWSNTHAGVMYGFVYLAVRWGVSALALVISRTLPCASAVPGAAEQRVRACLQRTTGLALSGMLSAITVQLINPSGVRVLLLPVTYFADPFWHGLIAEFRSMTWQQDPGFFVALAALVALQLATRRAWRFELAVPCWIFALLALRSQRCVLFFALAAVPYAAGMAAQCLRRCRARIVTAGMALLALLWVGVTLTRFVPDRVRPFGIGFGERLHPLGVYSFMREAVQPQRLFNSMAYGAGMLWWLYPDFRPFVDGRCEAYSKAFWRDVYRPVERGDPAWREVFAGYDIGGALLYTGADYAEFGLARALHADPDWALVAFDDCAQLYLRRTPGNAAAIAAHAYLRLWPGGTPVAIDGPEDAAAVRREAWRALQVAPRCRYAQLSLARAELVLGNWPVAVACYAAALATPGMRAGPYIRRDYGYALYRAGRLDQADRVLAGIPPETEPDCRATALLLRHHIALDRGEHAAADRLIRAAYGVASRNAEVARAYHAWLRREKGKRI